VLSEPAASSPNIGTLSERSLHAALKDWYAQPGDEREVKVDGYIIDIVRGDLLVEIQTRSFTPLKRKLAKLTETHQVRLAHPVASERWIVKMAADGESLIERRKSPRKGYVEHIFMELVSIPHLIERDNFSLDVLLIREEQVWCQDGRGSWRRKGWSLTDRRLIDVVHQITFRTPDDFRALLPPDLPPEFTVKDVARGLHQPENIAGKMMFCLRAMNAVQLVGKKGRAYLYSI
jgi:hypothetical protein